MQETIVALSSGSLPSGIAVVRISGPASTVALEALTGSVPAARRAVLRRIGNIEGLEIDRGLVLFFQGPATVTGEDLAELHLHGGRAVVAACLEALTALPGIRLAEAGEFTRRAFENGRIDLTEAEGLADLLAAETASQHRLALSQVGGSLRGLYEGWMTSLVQARAMLEASLDFSDEGDVGEDAADAVAPALARLATEMKTHLASAHRGEILRDGFRVAIIGAPNVGKSSLLNALADRDVAIVSDIPGTTRDVIDVSLDLGGIRVRISDTAGLRDTEDAIESIGIARAQEAAAAADLVLVLDDGTATHVKHGGSGEGQKYLRLRTKSDLMSRDDRFGCETLAVSTATGEGLSQLLSVLARYAEEAAGDPGAVVPVRLRHREIVADALALLGDAQALSAPEIQADGLRRATDRLGALTGRVGVEDLLDVIFSEFCIGK
ncbi:tRNA modification GTPase MnmE [Aureimonas sp. SA4125]|uniref:tRNA uridine-5-carboxymethylaminomethyl(34) synthesis GTPase MnmE n=1 Tax=Aureimonas sp. SA4125 TaxID=2826993 RepID=UPI001CC3AE89|nr:tRNA uridine-5-carboxymethylaminomethyl(34) synthesis GTPase MnmE [Aureimonas sp. SA4125]BDA86848.1 tRNA modification GTPase MnmE [Aureimonas sp. SA4125]